MLSVLHRRIERTQRDIAEITAQSDRRDESLALPPFPTMILILDKKYEERRNNSPHFLKGTRYHSRVDLDPEMKKHFFETEYIIKVSRRQLDNTGYLKYHCDRL